MTELRKGLPELPARIKVLPLDHRGYPIPWFVEEPRNDHADFRIASSGKRYKATKERLCWLCGGKLGRNIAFVIGPMCAINRNTSEPGNHRDCALFAVQACPFLILPDAKYRLAHLPKEGGMLPHLLPGNPGASCIWITDTYQPYAVDGTFLIRIGEPSEVLWYCEGKQATRMQIQDCLDKRLPLLSDIAKKDGPQAEKQLVGYIERFQQFMPVAA